MDKKKTADPIPFDQVLEALEEHWEKRRRLKNRLDQIRKELKSIKREIVEIEGRR
jgi:hypothetical protein